MKEYRKNKLEVSDTKPILEAVMKEDTDEKVLEAENSIDYNTELSNKRIKGNLGYVASVILPFSSFVVYGATGMHEYFPTIVDAIVIASPIICPFIWSTYLTRLDSAIGQPQNKVLEEKLSIE